MCKDHGNRPLITQSFKVVNALYVFRIESQNHENSITELELFEL